MPFTPRATQNLRKAISTLKLQIKCLKVLRQLVLGLELLDVGTQMLILLRYMRSAMNRNVNTESLRLGEAFSDKLKEIYMDKVSETARQDVTG